MKCKVITLKYMVAFLYVWERKCLSRRTRSIWGWSAFPYQVSLLSLHHSEWEICESLKGEKWGFAPRLYLPHLFFVVCFWAIYLSSLHLLLTPLLPCCECWSAGGVAFLQWELALTRPYGSGSSNHTYTGISTQRIALLLSPRPLCTLTSTCWHQVVTQPAEASPHILKTTVHFRALDLDEQERSASELPPPLRGAHCFQGGPGRIQWTPQTIVKNSLLITFWELSQIMNIWKQKFKFF